MMQLNILAVGGAFFSLALGPLFELDEPFELDELFELAELFELRPLELDPEFDLLDDELLLDRSAARCN